jgi:hypothetical protein
LTSVLQPVPKSFKNTKLINSKLQPPPTTPEKINLRNNEIC